MCGVRGQGGMCNRERVRHERWVELVGVEVVINQFGSRFACIENDILKGSWIKLIVRNEI